MSAKSPLPKRPRLRGFDYAASGYYFVTVVTNYKACTLGSVLDFQIVHSDLGLIVEEHLLGIPNRFPHISIDSYVIMPNHVHALFWFGNAAKPVTLSRVVNELKSRVSVRYHKLAGRSEPVWQYGFYDVVVRSEKQLFAIRQYIEANPIKWDLDELNPAVDESGASACTTIR